MGPITAEVHCRSIQCCGEPHCSHYAERVEVAHRDAYCRCVVRVRKDLKEETGFRNGNQGPSTGFLLCTLVPRPGDQCLAEHGPGAGGEALERAGLLEQRGGAGRAGAARGDEGPGHGEHRDGRDRDEAQQAVAEVRQVHRRLRFGRSSVVTYSAGSRDGRSLEMAPSSISQSSRRWLDPSIISVRGVADPAGSRRAPLSRTMWPKLITSPILLSN